MSQLSSLNDLFIDEISDLYSAEKQLVSALPKMVENASNPELRQAISEHFEETKYHVTRLEKVFESIGENPMSKACKAMEGLIREASEVLVGGGDPNVLDAAIIAMAQRAEHYEIAAYGTVCTFADLLDYEDAKNLLHQTLEEEKKANETLNDIAEDTVNPQALEVVGTPRIVDRSQ